MSGVYTQSSSPLYPPAIAASGNLVQEDGSPGMLRVNPATGALKTEVSGAGSGGTSNTDGDTFTAGGSGLTASGGVYNDGLSNVTSGAIAEVRVTTQRAFHTNLRNASGTEIGTLSTPIRNQQVGTGQMQIVDGGGNPVTVTGNKLDVNATVSGSNPAAGATGSAVPSQASYDGLNVGGTLRGQTGVNPSGSVYAAQSDFSSIAGTTVDTNSGTKSAGTQRVVICTDQPALTNKLLVTPDSVALPSHQSVNVDQIGGATLTIGQQLAAASIPVILPSATITTLTPPTNTGYALDSSLSTIDTDLKSNITLHAGANIIGKVTTDQTTHGTTDLVAADITKVAGSNIATGHGTASGAIRVELPTDGTGIVGQGGTWTVQPGNTANTTAWLVQGVAGTGGGATPYHYIAAASANQDSQNVKASAGVLYGIAGFCTQASIRYLKVYDKASAPTSADTPIYTMLIPGNAAGAGAVDTIGFPGIGLSNGLSFRLTTGLADNDTGACTASDCVINLRYK